MPLVTELDRFRDFLEERIAARDLLTPEQAVELWRNETPPGDGLSDLEAVRAAVEDLRNGDRGRPFEEVVAELQARIDAAGEP
jgi:hypothetical protein